MLNMEFSSYSWVYSWAGGMGKCALQGQTTSIWARRIRVWEGAGAMTNACSGARARNTSACPSIWKRMAHNFAQHAHVLKSPKKLKQAYKKDTKHSAYSTTTVERQGTTTEQQNLTPHIKNQPCNKMRQRIEISGPESKPTKQRKKRQKRNTITTQLQTERGEQKMMKPRSNNNKKWVI